MAFLNFKNLNLKNTPPIYLVYGAITFLSAFLLFLVQPLISKYILPWFGGTASVWTMAMLFFQTTLLLGYIYAHLISKYLSPKKQAVIHLSLLFVSLALLPILPGSSLKPGSNDNPILHIMILLSISVGLQAIILSATSPLIQTWIAKIKTEKSPYQLYALSNAGSLIALLGFPFLFEPLFSIRTQAIIWSVLFFVFVLFFVLGAFWFFKFSKSEKIISENFLSDESQLQKPAKKIIIWWLLLSASACTLLLAVTNKISQDISVVPLFWIVPLALYLLSFIIPFSSENFIKWFSKRLFHLVIVSAIIIFCSLVVFGALFFKYWQIFTLLLLLFLFSLICNTELARLKPIKQYLTSYYLLIALGGVFGAVFTGIIAPIIFNFYAELPLILLICLVLTLTIHLKNKIAAVFLLARQNLKARKYFLAASIIVIMYVVLVGSGVVVFFSNANPLSTIVALRNFYGTLRIREFKNEDLSQKKLLLISGGIIHGSQFMEEQKQKIATTYYGEKSGIGLVFKYFADKKIRVGAVGLGSGTIAVYGKKDDYIKFYEINPEVVALTNKYFTFLKDSQAKIEIELGDGRLSLERENPQNFDLIVVDAFTGDSIPIHLLTKEAFEIYLKNLKSDGVMAFDVSNRYLELNPVLYKLAANFKMHIANIFAPGSDAEGTTASSWVLLSRDARLFDSPLIKDNQVNEIVKIDNFKLWTDDYSNLFSVLRSPFSSF